MASRIGVLQLLLGVVGGVLAIGAGRELTATRPLPPPAPRSARPPAAVAPPAEPRDAGGHDLIAEKNLFSPHRTEAPAAPVVASGPKPTLHGVVMDGATRRAYLEDPIQKRAFAYAIGDPVGDGRVQSITDDRVLIGRAGGTVEVLLRDPAKPRPPAPPAPGSATARPAAGSAASAPAQTAPPTAGALAPDAQAAAGAATARADR